IAQTTLTALDANPDKVLEIMQLALTDFQSGRAAVLNGDRQCGGNPSVALQALAQPSSDRLEVESFSLTSSENSEAEILSLEELFNSPQSDSQIEIVEPIRDLETFAIDPTFNEGRRQEAGSRRLDLMIEYKAEKNKELINLPEQTQDPIFTSKQGQVQNITPTSLHPQNPKPTTHNLSIRVDLNRLERMNNFVGELLINNNSLSLQNEQLSQTTKELLNRSRQFQEAIGKIQNFSDRMLLQGLLEETIQLQEKVEDITLVSRQSQQTIESQRQTINSLKDELMWARMLPIGEILSNFPRTLRDLCLKYNKSVNLKVNGAEVLVDRGIFDKLRDPLLHLLRNAFDHGIESSETRQQQGKPEAGTIEISAYHKGDRTIIEVSDDGAGIKLEKIAQKAIANGSIAPEELAALPEKRIIDLIFEPSFSTADRVSELSGRGVGLDVVRSQLQAIKGNVAVTSAPGKGTTFSLHLPLTLTIAKLLICSVDSHTLAFPLDTIEEIVIPKSEQIQNSETQKYLSWRDRSIKVHRLADLLDYNYSLPKTSLNKTLFSDPATDNLASPMLIIRNKERLFALEIDRLEAEKELVIKPFSSAIAPPSYTYGCTIWGDGSLFPVIDGAALIEYVESQKSIATAIELNLNKTT
ncbi:MAG: ATP-binding protein, partial [Xenococcaceae cyanobacterium]